MKRFVLLLVFIIAFGWIIAAQAQEPELPGRYSLHLVQSGNTLWSISRQYMPEIDPRQGVEWIRKANGLEGSIIQPGDILNVPDASGPLLEPLGPRYSSEAAAKAADEEVNRLLGFTVKEELIELETPPPPEVEVRSINTASRGRKYTELVVEATAYTPGYESTGKNPGDQDYGVTYSGFNADTGAIAVDPQVIPLGSVCWVEGYGYAIALDTGSAIKGNKVDVFFWELDKALTWGRKQVRVRIYSLP